MAMENITHCIIMTNSAKKGLRIGQTIGYKMVNIRFSHEKLDKNKAI